MSESTKPATTLADYVASAIGPVLIMTLIGSLVFFLVEVLYIGEYYSRLAWFVFFYIFGSVWVARISMHTEYGNRAGLYGSVLALAMWGALMMYVQFPQGTWAGHIGWAIHLAIVLLIWWCAHRLTWDSTLDADQSAVAGRGLLDAAGLDRPGAGQDSERAPEAAARRRGKRRRRRQRGFIAWWERYQQYREEKKERPRTHGVWVVYFSLAALPLFGLGQAVIPVEHTGRRQYAFWLMCIYVASGLGLLLTTTFLGLRRYLSQKRLHMPASITSTWLFFGTCLILALLVAGALMPRPYPEFSPVEQFFGVSSAKQNPSDWAVLGKEGTPDKDSASGIGGHQKPKNSGNNGGPDPSADQGQGPGKYGNTQDGSTQNGKANDGSSSGKSEQGSGKSGSQDEKSGSNSGQKPKGGTGAKDQKQESGGSQQQDSKNGKSDDKKADNAGQSPGTPSTPPKPPNPSDWLKSLADVLKWVVLGVVIVVVGFFLLRALLGFLGNFTFWAKDLLNWLRSFWDALWGRKQKSRSPATKAAAEKKKYYRPFSWFRDPFHNGSYRNMSEAELIHYSFAALEAWGRERQLARPDGQTALEFARRVATEHTVLENDALTLANYYATAAYAPALLEMDCFDDLRRFWESLAQAAHPPRGELAMTGA
jgi:hypothetical protein